MSRTPPLPPGQSAGARRSQDFGERIIDGPFLTEGNNSILGHGVTLLLGGSGGLITNPVTPPSSYRHPVSPIARTIHRSDARPFSCRCFARHRASTRRWLFCDINHQPRIDLLIPSGCPVRERDDRRGGSTPKWVGQQPYESLHRGGDLTAEARLKNLRRIYGALRGEVRMTELGVVHAPTATSRRARCLWPATARPDQIYELTGRLACE